MVWYLLLLLPYSMALKSRLRIPTLTLAFPSDSHWSNRDSQPSSIDVCVSEEAENKFQIMKEILCFRLFLSNSLIFNYKWTTLVDGYLASCNTQASWNCKTMI